MSYCRNCGKQISPDHHYCMACGTKVITLPVPKKEKPADPPGTPSEIAVFVLGIVSIVLSANGLPGLIVSLIARAKVRAREQAIEELTGKSRIGKTLATIALPVSIAFMVLIVMQTVASALNSMKLIAQMGDYFRQLFEAFAE